MKYLLVYHLVTSLYTLDTEIKFNVYEDCVYNKNKVVKFAKDNNVDYNIIKNCEMLPNNQEK